MPVLHYNGEIITQSLVIARLAARKSGLAGKTEMDEFFCDAFVNTDLGAKLIEIFFERDPDKKAEMVKARMEPTHKGLDNLAKMVKVL